MIKTPLFLLLVILLPATASAYNFVVDNIYYNINGTNASVTFKDNSFNSYSGDVLIPASVTYNGTTYPVTEIGEDAFCGCSGLTSITIPNSVTEIDFGAFMNCSGLTSIDIPNSVTSIGDWAFLGCYGLTSVTFPNSVTEIGNNAFYGCSRLTSVTIPNSVSEIGEEPFSFCGSLTNVTVESGNTSYDSRNNCNAIIETATNTLIAGCMNTVIPNSVTEIGKDAFGGCYGLTSVTIPNSVTTIGEDAFNNCMGLTSIDIPNSVTSIGIGAFAACIGLSRVIVENGNTSYDSRNNCNAIIETSTNTLITGCMNSDIPNSVTEIGKDAFRGCSRLTDVTIPNSVTKIGFGAFMGCYELTSVIISGRVATIGDWAFGNCDALQTVTCQGKVPPAMADFTCFSSVAYRQATLKVQRNYIETYTATDYWYKFEHIEGFASIGPGDVDGDGYINISDVTALID